MFKVETVHPDWYEDGIECSGECQQLENCWRLDFAVGGNEYQAQLFGLLDDKFQFDEDEDFSGRTLTYKSFRLFLERDNRLPDGSGFRWDYACYWSPLTPERALALLTAGEVEAVANMEKEVKLVTTLKNDRAFVAEEWRSWEKDEWERRKKEAVEAHWAKLDKEKVV